MSADVGREMGFAHLRLPGGRIAEQHRNSQREAEEMHSFPRSLITEPPNIWTLCSRLSGSPCSEGR